MVGLGSRLSSDDEIGLALVEALVLEPDFGDRCVILENADPTTLASTLMGWHRPVILVDAADMGLDPGGHCAFPDDEARLMLKSDSDSTHGLSLAEGLALARTLGFDHPICIFGIQPFDLSPGQGLTLEMKAKFPKLLAALRREAR